MFPDYLYAHNIDQIRVNQSSSSSHRFVSKLFYRWFNRHLAMASAASSTFALLLLAAWLLTFNCWFLHGMPEPRKLYIAYMGERKHEDPNAVTASHHETLTAILGSKEEALGSMVYSYKHGFSGFAAMLTDEQATLLAELPEVISVKPSRKYKMSTTRSWDFLGLNYAHPTELLSRSRYGEDIIIGMVDSGIWPESRSFSDEGYGPVPRRWKGVCQTGVAWGSNNCSRKIIGARYYTGGIDEAELKNDFLSPRDHNGHGTFTASVAAGGVVEGVNYHGLASGVARGGAPHARLAIYKAVWGSGRGLGSGNSATVLAAIDDAIHDGVDVLSLSLAEDEDSFGAMHAVESGITVVYAGGNAGPVPKSIRNTAPWVITVAASSMDRSFPTNIILGSNQTLVGQAVNHANSSMDSFKKLVLGSSCAQDDLKGVDVSGSIVICVTVSASPLDEIITSRKLVFGEGAVGIIFATFSATSVLVDSDFCGGYPCVFVDYDIAVQIVLYHQNERSPVVKIEATHNIVGKDVLAPKIAGFSSRGPSPLSPTVLKPDLAAPGVNIIAAEFNGYVLGSGTSAAAPHVSGVVALLKALHPDWSHAAIKSALVTTASTADGNGLPIYADSVPRKLADPFDFGGGNINPNEAADPGLVYDIDSKEYRKYYNCTFTKYIACTEPAALHPGHQLNLPSISIPDLRGPLDIWRKVTNVGKVDTVYKAVIVQPPGVQMEVQPSVLAFDSQTKVHSFKVSFRPLIKVQGDYTFGSLTWDDGCKKVRIPIAVRITIQDYFSDVA